MNFKDDIHYFSEEGYMLIQDVFALENSYQIIKEAYSIKIDKEDYSPIMNPHMQSKAIMSAISNHKILKFVEHYFNEEAFGLQTEFFFMPPKTKGFTPHQDNSYIEAEEGSFISAWIALTDINKDNGGLIIWPGSHKEKKLDSIENLNSIENFSKQLANQDQNARRRSTIIPSIYKEYSPSVKRGEVLMIHQWLVHSSNDNNSVNNRYVLLCTYLKKGASFRPGKTAKRKPFKLVKKT